MSGSPPPGRILTSEGSGPLAPDEKEKDGEESKGERESPESSESQPLALPISIPNPPNQEGLLVSPMMQSLWTLREMWLASLCKYMEMSLQVGLPPTAGVLVICPWC